MSTAGRKIGWLVLAAALFAFATVLFVVATSHREPSYQGKPLSYWLRQRPPDLVMVVPQTGAPRITVLRAATFQSHGIRIPAGEASPDECDRALKAMGTNAVPFLMAKLRARNSAIKLIILRCTVKLGFNHYVGFKHYVIEPPLLAHGEAITGLEALKPLPDFALQQLLVLSTNADLEIAESAKFVLSKQPPSSPNIHTSSTVLLR